MTLKAGKAPDYRDREPTKIQRPLPSIPQRIESDLDVCERGIETARNSMASSFRVIGKYVKRVLTAELWKKGDYLSFGDWCEKRWGWSERRGYQIAEGEMAIESLPAELCTIVQNEGQARALLPIKEEARAAVVKRAFKSVPQGEPVTAKCITQSIKPRERKKKSTPVVIDVTPEPKPQKRVHDCPMCRCGE